MKEPPAPIPAAAAVTPSAPREPAVLAAVPKTNPAPMQAGPPAATFDRKVWSFKNGPLPELQTLLGSWDWCKLGRSGVMRTAGATAMAIVLPVRVGHNPFKVIIKQHTRPSPDNVSRVRPMWLAATGTPTFDSWHKTTQETGRDQEVMEAWFVGRNVIQFYNHTLNALEAYENEHPGDRLCIVLKSVEVSEITLETLRPEDIPAEYRSRDYFVAKLTEMGCTHELAPAGGK